MKSKISYISKIMIFVSVFAFMLIFLNGNPVHAATKTLIDIGESGGDNLNSGSTSKLNCNEYTKLHIHAWSQEQYYDTYAKVVIQYYNASGAAVGSAQTIYEGGNYYGFDDNKDYTLTQTTGTFIVTGYVRGGEQSDSGGYHERAAYLQVTGTYTPHTHSYTLTALNRS